MSIQGMVLKPGDVLLYKSNGLFPWAIRVKTWSEVNHTETYLGNGLSAASREGSGVDTYKTRLKGLLYVCRPATLFDFQFGVDWHETVKGQGYDYLGLMVFFLARKSGHNNKMFCSEHTTRMANMMGIYPFGHRFDCDRVPPAYFLATIKYDVTRINPDSNIIL